MNDKKYIYTVVLYYDVDPIATYEFETKAEATRKQNDLASEFGYENVSVYTEEVQNV